MKLYMLMVVAAAFVCTNVYAGKAEQRAPYRPENYDTPRVQNNSGPVCSKSSTPQWELDDCLARRGKYSPAEPRVVEQNQTKNKHCPECDQAGEIMHMLGGFLSR